MSKLKITASSFQLPGGPLVTDSQDVFLEAAEFLAVTNGAGSLILTPGGIRITTDATVAEIDTALSGTDIS